MLIFYESDGVQYLEEFRSAKGPDADGAGCEINRRPVSVQAVQVLCERLDSESLLPVLDLTVSVPRLETT